MLDPESSVHPLVPAGNPTSPAPKNPASGVDTRAILVHLDGLLIGRCHEFLDEPLQLGRGHRSVDVLLEGRIASRRHAVIYRHLEGCHVIDDLGSRNGTWVNNTRIQRPTPLNNGDIVQAGTSCFRFVSGKGSEAIFFRQIQDMLIYDRTTGAHSRGYLDSSLRMELARSRRMGAWLSLLFIDVDRFKEVNSRYGHVAGDRVLSGVCRILRDGLRRSAPLSRFGGDEFVALLPDSTLEAAVTVAQRLRCLITQSAVSTGCSGLILTISVGVASCEPGSLLSSESLLEAGAEALRRAKAAGGNCVEI